MGFSFINRTDLIEAEKERKLLDAERIAHENVKLKAQNKTLEAQNDFLSDCLIELSELVYRHEEKLNTGKEASGNA